MSVGNTYFENYLVQSGFVKCHISNDLPIVYKFNHGVYIFRVLDKETGKMMLLSKSIL